MGDLLPSCIALVWVHQMPCMVPPAPYSVVHGGQVVAQPPMPKPVDLPLHLPLNPGSEIAMCLNGGTNGIPGLMVWHAGTAHQKGEGQAAPDTAEEAESR